MKNISTYNLHSLQIVIFNEIETKWKTLNISSYEFLRITYKAKQSVSSNMQIDWKYECIQKVFVTYYQIASSWLMIRITFKIKDWL